MDEFAAFFSHKYDCAKLRIRAALRHGYDRLTPFAYLECKRFSCAPIELAGVPCVTTCERVRIRASELESAKSQRVSDDIGQIKLASATTNLAAFPLHILTPNQKSRMLMMFRDGNVVRRLTT